MVKYIKTVLLGLVLLTTIVANASKIETTKNSKNKVVYITLTDIAEGEVLSINNSNGLELFSETLHQSNSYRKEFDFSTFPTGVYYLKTKKESNTSGIDATQIIVQDDEVSIIPNAIKIFKTPELKLYDESILKIVLNNPRNLPINISIYDPNGIEIKTNYLEDKTIYKAYNFNELEKGTYTISISQGDGYFMIEEITF